MNALYTGVHQHKKSQLIIRLEFRTAFQRLIWSDGRNVGAETWTTSLYAGAYECATAPHILVGCGQANLTQRQLLAIGNSITSKNFGTNQGANVIPYFVEENGVTWYFSDQLSWGFFPTGGEDAYPNECDTTEDTQRLCWHTSEYIVGYRCGNLNEGSFTEPFNKYIYVPICSFDGTECDDGNACTEGDTCTAGTCAGTPITCTPSSSCVSSTCVAGQCVEESICGPVQAPIQAPVQAPVQAPAAAPQKKASAAVAMSSIYAASLMLGSAVVVALM